MGAEDRIHWDTRYDALGAADPDLDEPPPGLATVAHLLPSRGTALELACGRGRAVVWLARRGLAVHGVDVSPVAIDLARGLATTAVVADRCRLDVVDLDGGLPDGPPVDLLLCHRFHAPALHEAMAARLAPGGVLAVAVLSEVGAGPGRHRARPGALRNAFGHMEVLAQGEADGEAWLIARG